MSSQIEISPRRRRLGTDRSSTTASGRYVALERTPDKEHALRDARAYSARHHGIPVSVLSGPLAVVLDRSVPSRRRQGEISIWLDKRAGDRWRVDHWSASGDSVGSVGAAASLSDAVALARDAATRLGATFDQGSAA
ncbi:hypothetical protein MKK75_06120 [Methylobacterium sp. J-030]|uniref:hypothetical protein n=1 Tax=Methylobacterium sp. J-030 TaxID=2836627 RepID=UPI001FBA4FD2|nr:hypothetical protein [Methylobacterium sp. J-030]MCJ2068389.1 hypothetical protein [Methylobacterium sp. J-030]